MTDLDLGGSKAKPAIQVPISAAKLTAAVPMQTFSNGTMTRPAHLLLLPVPIVNSRFTFSSVRQPTLIIDSIRRSHRSVRSAEQIISIIGAEEEDTRGGLEGIVSKRADSRYQFGRFALDRSPSWFSRPDSQFGTLGHFSTYKAGR
jgi:hypothetical protein